MSMHLTHPQDVSKKREKVNMSGDLVKRFLAYATGGRPMKRLDYRFTDHISGDPVYYYEDTFGRIWMATSAWALFRVAKPYGGSYD